MLDRPAATDATHGGSPGRPAPGWPFAFLGMAGLIGAGGVAVGAAGAHGSGGELARLSSEFLLIHAATIVAGAGIALALPGSTALLPAALGLLALGAVLFGGELALAALLDWRPFPLAAPAGGLCLVAGWLCLAASGLASARTRGREPDRP